MSRLEIRVSEFAGYCWGVERALKMALEAGENAEGPIYTLGPLIHNPGVIAELAAQGIDVIEDVREGASGTVIVRSHGVPGGLLRELADRGLNVVDATCTFVKAAQDKAARLHDAGYLVIILGEPVHPEVLGIKSYAGPDCIVVETPEDLPVELPKSKVGIVVQTTQSLERLVELTAALVPRVRELLVHNTICNATEQRQESAVAMAREVDLVIVIGGRNSGNTSRLAELCAQVQSRTFHVEAADEIDMNWFAGSDVKRVGVTAGASTPPDQIERVLRRLREIEA